MNRRKFLKSALIAGAGASVPLAARTYEYEGFVGTKPIAFDMSDTLSMRIRHAHAHILSNARPVRISMRNIPRHHNGLGTITYKRHLPVACRA